MSEEEQVPTTAQKHRRLLLRLALVVAAMFAFALFVLPPMYNVFCEVTGLNGKGNQSAVAGPAKPEDAGRTLTVQFLADPDPGLPWTFRPVVPSLVLHPGDIQQALFYVRNDAGHDITGRAVPSIAPAEASRYLKKTQCFCFNEQTLKVGEERKMPVIFYIDPALPKHITTITLAYKFYNLTDKAAVVSR